MLTHVPPPNSDGHSSAKTTLPQSNALDALECIGAPRSFARDEEIYAEADVSDNWYRVASGTVRRRGCERPRRIGAQYWA